MRGAGACLTWAVAVALAVAACSASQPLPSGEDSEPEEDDSDTAPFAVIVEHAHGPPCSGSLVSVHSVVTSATCARRGGLRRRMRVASALAMAAGGGAGDEMRRRVVRVAEGRVGSSLDIALLEMEAPFPQQAETRPILMATEPTECAAPGLVCHSVRAVYHDRETLLLRIVDLELVQNAKGCSYSERAICLTGSVLCATDEGTGVVCGGKLCGALVSSTRKSDVSSEERESRSAEDEGCGELHRAVRLPRYRRFLLCAHTLRDCERGDCINICSQRRLPIDDAEEKDMNEGIKPVRHPPTLPVLEARDVLERSEPDSQSEPDSHSEPDSRSKSETYSETDSRSRPESYSEPDSRSRPKPYSEPDSRSSPESYSSPESRSKPVSHSEPESRSKPVSDSETETRSKTVLHSEPEPELHSEPELQSVEVPATTVQSEAPPEPETKKTPDKDSGASNEDTEVVQVSPPYRMRFSPGAVRTGPTATPPHTTATRTHSTSPRTHTTTKRTHTTAQRSPTTPRPHTSAHLTRHALHAVRRPATTPASKRPLTRAKPRVVATTTKETVRPFDMILPDREDMSMYDTKAAAPSPQSDESKQTPLPNAETSAAEASSAEVTAELATPTDVAADKSEQEKVGGARSGQEEASSSEGPMSPEQEAALIVRSFDLTHPDGAGARRNKPRAQGSSPSSFALHRSVAAILTILLFLFS